MFGRKAKTLNKQDRTKEINGMLKIVQKNTEESPKYFNKLLGFLSDPIPENRIATCKALGKTADESAFTNISYWLQKEQDEDVINAMKESLREIRDNINAEEMKKM